MPLAKLERLVKPITRSTTLPPITLTLRAIGRVNGAAISHAFGCEYGGYEQALVVTLTHNPWDGLLSLVSPNGRRWLCIAQEHSWMEEREIIDHEPMLEFRGTMCGFEVIEIGPKRKMSNAPGLLFICESGDSDSPKHRERRLVQPVCSKRRKSSAAQVDSIWATLDPEKMNT